MPDPTVPSISVVVPVYNHERYLGDAIASIVRQHPVPDEIVVVDDGSTDGSAAVARGFGPPVDCISVPRRGVAGALNAGINASSGEFLGFLDADDLWPDGRIELQLAALEADSTLDVVFGHVDEFYSPELDVAERSQRAPLRRAVPGLLITTMLVRRRSFDRVGPFREGPQVGEQMEWLFRARAAGLRTMMQPQTVLHRRVHGRGHRSSESGYRTAYLEVVREALRRRRAQ